jgi:DNA-binding NarL/FixJ family response regulator
VRNILQSEKDWEVCAEATNGREAVAMTAAKRPDVVVLDISMPGLNGLEAARLIHEQCPETEMVVLSLHEPDEVMSQLAGTGVRAYVLKSDLQDLVVAIRGIQQPQTVGKAHVAELGYSPCASPHGTSIL